MISLERSQEIAETYYEDVYRFCHSELINEDDAKDVTQEVFLLFQKKYRDMNDINIKSWLFNVAQKKIFTKFREIKKNSKLLDYDEIGNTLNESSLFAEMDDYIEISEEEIESRKFKILEQLSPEERTVFKMIYIEHLKYSEIAEKLDLTENAISIRAMRIRNKIKKMVAEAFVLILLIIIFFILI